MILKRFYDDKLAHASYLIGCPGSGEALVIDAGRDVEPYIEAAASEGLRIVAVTETHIHADFLSGSRQLAKRTGATLHLSAEGGSEWQYGAWAREAGARFLCNGDTLAVGNAELRVMHTPGHTPEHLSFLLVDRSAADIPLAVFTGDFVFVGDVGRPDLLERAAGWSGTMEPGARRLFASLQHFKQLPDYTQIWPAHGSGSACGKSLGGTPATTVGYERLTNWAFKVEREDDFVHEVLSGQPEPPRYFAEMKRLNQAGPDLLQHDPAPPRLSGPVATGVQVVDLRPRTAYEGGHRPATLSIPLGRGFTTWAGWLLDYNQPIALVAENAGQAAEATRALASIGLDAVQGWFSPAPADTTRTVELPMLELQDRHVGFTVVDVRSYKEWQQGHIRGAMHIPLGELAGRSGELPANRPVVTYCRSGARASMAASVLERAGVMGVHTLAGTFSDWKNAGLPVQSPELVPSA